MDQHRLSSGYEDVFYHDVAPELAAEASRRERDENSRALRQPWPLPTWPEVRTKYLLCREDRMFSAEWARRHARERLGIEPDEIDGGHYVALSRPRMLADRTRGLRSRHSVSRSVRQRVTHRARESIRGAAGRGSNRQDPTSARSLRHPIQGTPRARQGLPAGLTVAFS